MPRFITLLLLPPLFCFAPGPPALVAQQPDRQLAAYIDGIRAIDNHAHIPGEMPADTGYDGLRCTALPPSAAVPAAMAMGDALKQGWETLYGWRPTGDASPEDATVRKQWAEHHAAAKREHGAGWYGWVAKQAGIETVFANRVTMLPELKAPEFRWVPYDDGLLFPLNNRGLEMESPDKKIFFPMAEQIGKSFVQESGLSAVPETLDGYMEKVVRPTLARQKKGGAVAIKFEVAYLRTLDFEPASHEDAAKIYAQYITGARVPAAGEYKTLQDYLFRAIAAEAGAAGLPLHIHTGFGCGDYFNYASANPTLLESVLNDPALRETRFVLLHGGTPFNTEMAILLLKPNVWADTSLMVELFSPQQLARILRGWLEMMPGRILFGTDASPDGDGLGWEETMLQGSRNGRRAVAIALTGMMEDGLITRERAQEIARGIFRDNAAGLYHLP